MGFKNGIIERIALLRLNIVNTIYEDYANFANNWASVLSTTFYTVAFMLFVQVIFANVTLYAGYTKNEVLLMYFIGQLQAFSIFAWSEVNIQRLIRDVNSGDLDLILVKPLPSLFYVTFRRIKILDILRDGTPPLLIVGSLISWSEFSITPLQLLYATVIFILGQFAFHAFQFMVACVVFWKGESASIYNATFEFWDINRVPYEGQSDWLRKIFTIFIPIMLLTPVSTSVLLGRLPGLSTTLFTIAVALVFYLLKSWVWSRALRSYTSASS
jgi:ABC-2 type transport system permease protein